MADRYLLESGAPDGYLLEDGTGVLLLDPPPTITIVEEQSAAPESVQISFTVSNAAVDDKIVLIHADNWYTLDNLNAPGGTAVTTWVEKTGTGVPVDGGSNDNHCRVWEGVVTTAGGTVVTSSDNTDHERYATVFVLRGTDGTPVVDVVVGSETDTAATSHVAPSATPTAGKTDDLMLCTWGTHQASTNYTVPGTMTAYTERDTPFNTYRSASEYLTSDAASGTRTATSSANQAWFAVTVLVKTADTGPLDVDLSPVTMTLTPQALDVVAGVVNLDLSPITLTLTPQALDPALPPLEVDLSPVTMTFAPQALDVVAGTVNLDLSPVTLALSPQPLTPVSGVVDLDLAPVTLTLVPQPLSPVSGVVNLDLVPVTLVLSPQALDPVAGSGVLDVDLVPVTLTITPQALDPVSGVVNLDLVPVTLTLAPQALDVVAGAVNLDLVPVTLTLEPQTLDPVSGVVNLDLSPVILTIIPQILDPTEPPPPTYKFFPPVEVTKPVGFENTLLLKGLHSRPIGLRLVNGVYVETYILVYERDILGKIEGLDYFYGGRRYTGLSQAVADLLIASGYTPEVES